MAVGAGEPKKVGAPSVLDGFSPIGVIAHEIKAPLAVIRQLTLELESGVMKPNETSAALEQIRLTSERSLRLASSLALSERLQEKLFATAPTNVQELCGDVLREMLPLYEAYDKVLTLRRVRRTPLAMANYDLLRRIVLNFADNALKYSDAGGKVDLYIKVLKGRDTIRVGVRDYGPAVPNGLWRKTSAATAHTRPDSSGLGLVLADHFARSMGAVVGVIRHRDGASFYVDMVVSRQLALL